MNSSVSSVSVNSVEPYRTLISLIEQLEQIVDALVKLIGQIEACVSDLEYMYDLVLLYPENSMPNDFDQLLSTYSLQRSSALEQQVNNLIVTMQSNRKDVEKEIERVQYADEAHTRTLTKTRLFQVLQSFTELIERYALNKNQSQIKFKRILAKQVKCINLSFTERALDRILEVDLTDDIVVFDKSHLAFRSSKAQSTPTAGGEEKQDELDQIKQNLTKLIKSINRYYLNMNGLFISTNTMFKQFCLICELVVERRIIAEVKEISFNEIVDFTARVANKMKTDYMLEYSTPILLPKKSQFSRRSILFSALVILVTVVAIIAAACIGVLLIVDGDLWSWSSSSQDKQMRPVR